MASLTAMIGGPLVPSPKLSGLAWPISAAATRPGAA